MTSPNPLPPQPLEAPPSPAAKPPSQPAPHHAHPDYEASCEHALSQLLARSRTPTASRRSLLSRRGVRWCVAGVGGFAVFLAVVFGGIWLRLGAGPINVDVVTPWLAEAIESNIGQGNTVQVGGTQIERVGRVRVAVRLRDVIVYDRDHAVVASAPKAEVRLSAGQMLLGRLRAESLNLVDAEIAIRIAPDGAVTVSTGKDQRPLATGVAQSRVAIPDAQAPGASAPSLPVEGPNALLAGLGWLDSLSLTGLDGQNLNEIGLKNGSLLVEDEQRGTRFTFENVSISVRRPQTGGVSLAVGEDNDNPWSLRAAIGPAQDGVRAIEIAARNVSTTKLLLALRLKDLTYSADLPLSGDVKGEIGRDGVPVALRGRVTSGAGTITDLDTPDYPMPIDQAEFNVEWDVARNMLLVPFKVVSGGNRVTLLAHLARAESANGIWELGFDGGTIVLAGAGDTQPLIFNKIAIRFDVDPRQQRVAVREFNINNGEIGLNGNGSLDYANEPLLSLTFVGTPMSVDALKRMWPILIVPEVREWVISRVERGTLQRLDVGVRSPLKNLTRRGPPIPDDGLLVTIAASNVTMRPVDDLPLLQDGEMRARVTGRTATVTIAQSTMDTAQGRRLAVNDIIFEVPDMVPKPSPGRVKMRVDGPVAALAEILASDRLSEFNSEGLDPATSKGTVSAQVTLNLPIKGELTKADTSYTIAADLNGFAAEKLVMNQKLEAGALKLSANNQGFQVRGDVKINGQPATLDYRKPLDGDADVKLVATLDDASRARLGVDLGPAVTGPVLVKLGGKLANGDRETRLALECDLTNVKLENLFPGWVKPAGKAQRAAFTLIQKQQSTRIEDLVIDGSGTSIKGTLEVDSNGELLNAAFPVFSPSDGDKASIKAERGSDGVTRVTLRGDVLDGRNIIKSAVSGRDPEAKIRSKTLDFDLDLKVGTIMGFHGETLRGVDVKTSRRGGAFKSLNVAGKLGRDTPLTGDMRGRAQGREVVYLETNDAGAFLRFTDTYAKVSGGQLALAMEPPTADTRPREGLINVRDFAVKGEASLDRVAASAPGTPSSVGFSRLRAEFTRQNGQLAIRDGVVKGPVIGGTIEGNIDFLTNQVRMSGTFVPMYGLNNMFGQIPIVGLFLGGGSNEGLIGVTYEVVGSVGQPVLRVNPISAMAPGVLRKIFEFGTGRQNNQAEFPMPNN